MKILLADAFPEDRLAELRDEGHDCDLRPELKEVAPHISGYDALVVRSTRVGADVFAAADHLKLVVRAGAGVNTIDTVAAADRGIYVCNVPGMNAIAVAELTMGLLLAIDRNIPDNVADLRAGLWDKARYQQAEGLAGRSIGIVGLGAIGLEVAARARAFAMEVHALARPRRDRAKAARAVDLDIQLHVDLASLAAVSDVLSFHVPLTDETRGMIGRDLLDLVRPGTVILNTSRGELIDEEALLEAIEVKGLRVGLDVFPDEPASSTADYESALARHPAVYGTHHIGASTEQAQDAIAAEVVEIVGRFQHGEVRNCVNLDPGNRGAATLVIRHLNTVGVLAGVLQALRGAGINVEQMENEIFTGGNAACATIRVSAPPPADLLAALGSAANVIEVAMYPGGPQ